ncbi:Hint domain-containing protein [Octadecabacter sp. 1_MG-2023]|uniref:Hint domain-containing protein n=1 Tax=unclassified Octadecabacter TaxID=196158 RepID=UPI001C092F62|nr:MULTISPECIES: Hint domain-containing protein [unclassified Octadecabacter]MBU2993789.1 Hint domain-containing protein [Octadecabacter sp. B2R22]MDO6735366.1 Hint domain-containing protein [Octadecabacter sp. 1_MG-2023]
MSKSNQNTIAVYPSDAFVVTDGVAEGDVMSFMDELVLDDVYQLVEGSQRKALIYEKGDGSAFIIAPETEVGTPGNPLYLDCTITLMARDSTTYEALVLVEVEGDEAAEVYLMPLATFEPESNYRLVGADRDSAAAKFGDVACVRFARGTHITLASGAQVPIEELKIGDRVLTRDAGPQAIRWIGETTLRAVGDFAPVVISAGALFNSRDLILSPDHRLFIYQREDRLGAGRSEVLVKVRHLINGDSVYQLDGGFVDYFQILFDDHQIIYAEGIAAETLLVDSRTRKALPEDVADGEFIPDHAAAPHHDFEVTESLANRPDIVSLLKRASSS